MHGVNEQAQREWSDWLASAPGRYLLDWEQQRFDAGVSDVFGFHAIQLGFGQLDTLRTNRMPARIIALSQAERDTLPAAWSPTQAGVANVAGFADVAGVAGDAVTAMNPLDRGGPATAASDEPAAHPTGIPQAATAARSQVIVGRFEELPFAEQSVDLVVMPHVLEYAEDPHQVLREVNRVLRPEGRVLLSGLNPISLWGARQALPGLARPFLPRHAKLIGLPRLRDWFQLLSFEHDRGRYGLYRPPCRTEAWLERTEFMERAGDRWWPICGAVYFVTAVKRVRAMRMIGPAWKRAAPSRQRVVVPAPQFAPTKPEHHTRQRTP